jgi:Kef-type K+ transport system membrane component KefB
MYQTLSSHSLLIFLVQIAVLLGAALLLGSLAALAGLPAVAGELCAGILLGPSLLGHLASAAHGWLLPVEPAQSHLVDGVGQIGVLLLVGLSGIQVDFRLVTRQTRTVLRVGLVGLVVPLALGAAAGLLLPSLLIGSAGNRATFTGFLGVAMAVSAIPVIAKTLNEMRLMHRNIGQLIMASSLLDDAFGWFGLSAVSAFVTIRSGQRAEHIAVALASLTGVVLAAALIGRPLARLIVGWLNRAASDAVYMAAMVTLILLAAAGAGALGLEPVFGAFSCGMVIASAEGLSRARLAPLQSVIMGIFAPIFFVTAGLRMNLGVLGSAVVLASAIAMLVVAVVGKFTGAFAGAWLSGLNRHEAIALGAGLNSRGVIQIVIAAVGLRIGVLTTGSYTIIVLIAVATSMMAAPVLRSAMRKIDQTEEEELRARELAIPACSRGAPS